MHQSMFEANRSGWVWKHLKSCWLLGLEVVVVEEVAPWLGLLPIVAIKSHLISNTAKM